MKKCCQCKEKKSLCEFGRLKSQKDGRRQNCKECRKKFYLKPEEQVERWNLRRKERMREMGLNSRGRIGSYETREKIRIAKQKLYEGHDYLPSCLKKHYAIYIRNGAKIEFETFKKIVFSNCSYCGQIPKQKKYSSCRKHFIEVNGIDRVDNDKDYSDNNIVPCCKTCNYAKRDMKVEDFKNWIFMAYNHIKGAVT